MSMSTHVVGFRPPDEKWKKMKAVWEACKKADMDPPEEVQDFFEYEGPDDQGVEVREEALRKAGAISQWEDKDGSASGYEIDVTKLPKDVKIVRVYNSW